MEQRQPHQSVITPYFFECCCCSPPTPPTLISSIKILEEKTTNLLLITAKILNQASTYTVQSLIKPVHMMYNLFQTCSFQEACHC